MAERDTGRFPQGSGAIAAAIVVAALILAWGSPKEPRFQIAGSGNGFVRLDTDSGELIACDLQQCRRIEEPLRAKTWGPFKGMVGQQNQVNEQQQPKQLPPPAPKQP
jgi:hypothetical protein